MYHGGRRHGQMARTVNVQEHAIRRDSFVDAASLLIQTKGYERMSIQDVLDVLAASRGAFYHYFESKEALLEAVIDRMGEAVIGGLDTVLADPALPAPEKLEAVFTTIGSYKAARRDLVLAILEVWLSDDNAIVRDKFRGFLAARLTPVLARILRQGAGEGSMVMDDPDETALVVVTLVQGLNEHTGHQFVAHQDGTATIESTMRTFGAFKSALERVLGVPPDSLSLMDEATLRWWFETDMKEREG
jgi:AcrR family transcriptional regulator